MAENPSPTDQTQTDHIVRDNARDSMVRDALLRLRQLGAKLPEIDAAAIVRAGRESDTRVS